MFSSEILANLEYIHSPLVLVPSLEALLKERYPRFIFNRIYPYGQGFDPNTGTVHISIYRPRYIRQGNDVEPISHEIAHLASLRPSRVLEPNFGLPGRELTTPPDDYSAVNAEIRVSTYQRNFLAWLPESRDPACFVSRYVGRPRAIEEELIDPTGTGVPWIGVAALLERDGRETVAAHIAARYALLKAECTAEHMLDRLDAAHRIVGEAAGSLKTA